MDLFEILKAEDVRLAKLFRKLVDTTSSRVQERELLSSQIRIQALAQIMVEEGHLYPALRLYPQLIPFLEHLEGEHREIKNFFDELNETPDQDPRFELLTERIAGQADYLMHWRKRELFPAAARIIPQEQAEMLGEVIEEEIKSFRREIAHA